MLSPEEFREKYPEEELKAELPDSPISSLRDIQFLYGKLYTLATAGGGDYASYLTPDAASDLVDEPDSLVVVRVDLSGDEPQLADDERGAVWVTRYTESLIPEVAHCYFSNKGAGIDHSLTHKSGNRKSAEKLAKYATDRLTRWPFEDAVEAVADTHDNGWIIQALAEIGEDEDLLDTISSEAELKLSDKTTSLLTVAVKLEPDGEYLLPGDVDVLNEGMRQQRLSKLISKGKATDSAGQATDLISGQSSRTVGTASDPLNYFLGKQLEKFPGLDPNEAWRSHPISEDAAVTLMNAVTFVDNCAYRTFGSKVYCLPYFFGKPTPATVYRLYDLLYDAATANNNSGQLTLVERAYLKREELSFEENQLRFYVSAVMPHQASRYDVFGETMNARVQYPASVARSHAAILRTTAFHDGSERSSPLPTHENWSLLSGGNSDQFLNVVSTGGYFFETFPEGDDDTDASADDRRIRALVSVLSGDSIDVSMLLEAYVDRLDEEHDEENGFPSFHVATQFAQLCALADADHDFLEAADGEQYAITKTPEYDSRTMTSRDEITIADGGFAGAEKLETFIEDTPALAESDERCASFLLGALVGAVGNYQEYEHDRSTTLVDQFPVKSVTRNRIKKVAEDSIEKALAYTRQEKKGGQSYPGTKFDYVIERLRRTILNPDPENWEIETDDLRFYYALGVAYGMNDYSTRSADDAESTAATPN
jgi:CRISPR-associated protein Cas8b/Csh1 subtype I-B